jgi:hypothetical protein
MDQRDSLNEVKLRLRKINKYKQYKDYDQIDSSLPSHMAQTNSLQQVAYSNISEFISLFQKLTQLVQYANAYIVTDDNGKTYKFNATKYLNDVVQAFNSMTQITDYLDQHFQEILKYLSKGQLNELKILKHTIDIYK